jgi:hypothetical protein
MLLLVPFPDDGQRILDVFLRVGIGVGVKNRSLGRNHIGNAVGEGRAHKRNIERFMTEKLGSAPTGNFSPHSLVEKSRCTSILSPERPMTLAPAAAKFSVFSAN